KGDDELLKLGARTGRHFPQDPTGRYAGHHPTDDRAAISHMEKARIDGTEYLLIPGAYYWWLGYYSEFARHLDETCDRVFVDEHCVIYRLPRAGEAEHPRHTGDLHESSDPDSPVARNGVASSPGGGTVAVPLPTPVDLPKLGGKLRIALDYPRTLPLR